VPALVVLTTAPDRKTADSLAKALVREKLAACVSVSAGAVSHYRWKGKIERAREALLVIKTLDRKFPALEKFISKNHPYDVPELVALRVARGSRKYLSWLTESVS